MTTLLLRDVHYSRVDKTRKYIYTLVRDNDQFTIEVGAIQKGDGKDILCVPTQTNCAQACRFCHTTALAGKVAVTNLTPSEMADIVSTAWIDAGLFQTGQPLLVSFIGVGEPAANLFPLIRAMTLMKAWASKMNLPIRWGMATMLPTKHLEEFRTFTGAIATLRIPLKVHLSLHYPTTKARNKWMPAAAPVDVSVAALQEYRRQTGNPIELHYTLIAGVNDGLLDIHALRRLIEDEPIIVKFLQYNPLPGDTNRSPDSIWTDFLSSELKKHSIDTEYYASPGADIQAACGMFLADAYTQSGIDIPLSKMVLRKPNLTFPEITFTSPELF